MIEQPQALIGHEDFQGGVAVLDEGREFLPQHLRSRIGDDQVEAHVAEAVAIGQSMVGGNRLPQALALLLEAEGQDCRVAAHQGRFRATRKVVRHHDPGT